MDGSLRSQGTQRDKLHHLQTPPSALTSSSGVLRANVLQSSPATLNQLRGSIVKTENRGVKLASADSNSSWQRGSRPTTKTDWLPDHSTAEADGLSFGRSSASANSIDSGTTSGPGWTQTSSNDTRSTSGSGFLASFFKGGKRARRRLQLPQTLFQEEQEAHPHSRRRQERLQAPTLSRTKIRRAADTLMTQRGLTSCRSTRLQRVHLLLL